MSPTAADISNAANKWCGEKDRETFYEDVIYFKHNWRSFPGLLRYVEEAVAARKAETPKGENDDA